MLKSLNGDCGSLLSWILVREVWCGEWVWFVVVKGCICSGLREIFGAVGFGVANPLSQVLFFPFRKTDFGKIRECHFQNST